MSGRWTWFLMFSVGVTGCSSGSYGGQSGTETKSRPCKVVSSTPIGPDDPTAQGTPNALAAELTGEHRTSIRYGQPPAGPYVDTELVLEVFLNVASARIVTSTRWDGGPSSSCGEDAGSLPTAYSAPTYLLGTTLAAPPRGNFERRPPAHEAWLDATDDHAGTSVA
jgi:hypothetical protein